MVNNNNFVNLIVERIKEKCGNRYEVTEQKCRKNNGVILQGIRINMRGEDFAPLIYLESYYEQYLQGREIDDIISDIYRLFQDNIKKPLIRKDQIMDFQSARARVVCRLINYDQNQELLKNVPNSKWCDLAMVYHLMFRQDEEGQMTALIDNTLLAAWGISAEDLRKLAIENSRRLLPPVLMSMNEAFQKMGFMGSTDEGSGNEERELDSDSFPLYILTNRSGIYGTAVLLYPGVLKDAADKIGSDLVILPSSVHEALLIPFSEGVDIAGLKALVFEINRKEVSVEERLSDTVYLYNRAEGRIEEAKDADSRYSVYSDSSFLVERQEVID